MLGSSPAGITEWPLGLKVRTAASQAANVEFESRRGHLWVGRIVAIAADCKSADSGLRQFESGPAHLCLRVRVDLRGHPAKVVCGNTTPKVRPSLRFGRR